MRTWDQRIILDVRFADYLSLKAFFSVSCSLTTSRFADALPARLHGLSWPARPPSRRRCTFDCHLAMLAKRPSACLRTPAQVFTQHMVTIAMSGYIFFGECTVCDAVLSCHTRYGSHARVRVTRSRLQKKTDRSLGVVFLQAAPSQSATESSACAFCCTPPCGSEFSRCYLQSLSQK